MSDVDVRKSGRVLIVTGASGVLGRAVVETASARGWRVAAIDHAAAPAGRTLSDDRLILEGVDLTDPRAARSAMGAVVDRFGRIDALANVAGGFTWTRVEAAEDAWARMTALNLTTAVNACTAALPHLKASGDGRIVNVGAAGARRAGPSMGPYAASKAGVHSLTEALAEELKSDGVTVNAVLPSIIDTPANRADMPEADPALWVAPADLAEVILFLASPQARAITGALIPVTGRV